MASILDILTNGPLGGIMNNIGSSASSMFGGGQGGGLGSSIGSVLNSLGSSAKNVAGEIRNQTPGGMGGLLGAGALGAILGNLMSSDAVKGVALAGAGAVAWNFYKKWAAMKQGQAGEEMPPQQPGHSEYQFGNTQEKALPAQVDPTADLVLRCMIYAARADGNIDAQERERINSLLKTMMPGQQLDGVIAKIEAEPLDPARIAAQVRSPEQADDVYRLSCATIDIDHFMERGYLDGLAQALGISQTDKAKIEEEASQAKKQLEAAASHA